MNQEDVIVAVKNLKNKFGSQWVHTGIDLDIRRREIIGIVGGSGSGKTTFFRSILTLQRPTSGAVEVFGTDIVTAKREQLNAVRQRWGVLFQQSALFSAMTVKENILFPIREFIPNLPEDFLEEIALLKIRLVGLPLHAAHKYPAQLSGGMLKRAAAARAIALDPELLFLDEPTSGLDPASSREFDQLILNLRDLLGLTIIVITHDPESLKVTDRVAFLGDGKLLDCAPLMELMKNPHPMIQEYFKGKQW
jgi:phospholipid/cholesterol/gamma-HCH transport system ATP-binding protein